MLQLSHVLMCEENYSVHFLKLIKYRGKMQRLSLKMQGKNGDSIY